LHLRSVARAAGATLADCLCVSSGASSFTRPGFGVAPEENIEAEPNPIGGAALVTQGIGNTEILSQRLRIFLANRAIALGWALKGACKPCAHRLFTAARWLVPEAQRYLVHRTGSHNRNRRDFELRSI
jgi:hypothetical protein